MFFKDFLLFIWERKLWWLTPLFLVLFLISGLIFLTQGTVFAPFIYTLF
jgi:hypothetical protein